MQLSFVTLLALSTVGQAFAAPSFFAQHELDSTSHRGGREGNSIFEKLRNDRRFEKFVQIVEKNSNLRDDLERNDGATTLFAPTNEAIERVEKEWQSRAAGSRSEWSDVLKYHVAKDSEITRDCMHSGAIIPTALKPKQLDGRHQRVRVSRFGDTPVLNMRAVVVGEEIKADNGVIHAIDGVLFPPSNVVEMVNAVPTHLSQSALALELTGLACDLAGEKALSVFAPSNAAWRDIGVFNNRYLFSCVGQQTEQRKDSKGSRHEWCEGRETLKKIMENHIADELAYSTDIMKERSMTLKTWGDSKMKVCAKETGENKGGDRGDKDRRRRKNEVDEHQNVNDYKLVVNGGESRIQMNDIPASNGNIHVLDNVIIGSAKLPFDHLGDQMM